MIAWQQKLLSITTALKHCLHINGYIWPKISYPLLSKSYTMGCSPVREDNPRALVTSPASEPLNFFIIVIYDL